MEDLKVPNVTLGDIVRAADSRYSKHKLHKLVDSGWLIYGYLAPHDDMRGSFSAINTNLSLVTFYATSKQEPVSVLMTYLAARAKYERIKSLPLPRRDQRDARLEELAKHHAKVEKITKEQAIKVGVDAYFDLV